MSIPFKTTPKRIGLHNVNQIFVDRTSSRSFAQGQAVPSEKLLQTFEAGRWSATCANNQGYKIIYAQKSKNETEWKKLFDLLDEGNQKWCIHADVLIAALAYKKFSFNTNYPNRAYGTDVGQVMANMSLQGSLTGLTVHWMAGFNATKAHEVLIQGKNSIANADDWEVLTMAAIGVSISKEEAEKEVKTDRNDFATLFIENGLE